MIHHRSHTLKKQFVAGKSGPDRPRRGVVLSNPHFDLEGIADRDFDNPGLREIPRPRPGSRAALKG